MEKQVRPVPRASLGEGDFALVTRMLRQYIGRQKWTVAFAILCMAGGAAMTAVLAWLLDPVIRLIFLEKHADMVLIVPAAVVAAVLVRAALNYGEAAITNSVGQRIIADIQRDMIKSMVAFDLGRLSLVHSGQ